MWIPFNIDRTWIIEIPIVVNGRPATAMIDTGATRTVLDRLFAERMGITSHADFRGLGLTGALSGGTANDVTIEVGGRRLTSLEPAVLDLSSVVSALGHPVQVILGHELFVSNLVEFDFSRSRLRLRSAGTDGEIGTLLQLGVASDRHRTLPLTIAEQPSIEAALDLGSGVPLYLHPDLVEHARLLEGLRTSTSATAGAEGVEVSRIAVLPSIEIGGTELRNVPVQVPRRWRIASRALVGLPVLNRFRLALDFGQSRAWVHPDPDAVKLPFPKDRSGLGAVSAQGRLRIIHVAEGSPAARSGLAPGEEIVSVDGRIVDEAYLRERPRIGQRPAGTVVVIELASGRTHRFTLEDYF